MRGAAVEAAWTAAHVALYPLGIAAEKAAERRSLRYPDELSLVQRALVLTDVHAASTPIVLVHGWVDNRSVFTVLRRQLRRRGFADVVTLNYGCDVLGAAERLKELVEEVCERTGHDSVHVVGHSMGGIVARWYVQRLGGDARVATLVTLGTPHAGTRAAHLFAGRAVRQLRRDSDVIRALGEPAPGCRTRFVAFWSDIDHVVVPHESARLAHPDLDVVDVPVSGIGHLSLPNDRRVVHRIANTLAHLENSGDTVNTMRAWTANA